MKLWTVSVEIEIPVLAETEEKAKRIASRRALEEEVRNIDESDLSAEECRHYPYGYDHDSLVWNDGQGDITLKEATEKYGWNSQINRPPTGKGKP